MESIVHTAWYLDSDKATSGIPIAANIKVFASTGIANSLYFSASGVNMQNTLQGQNLSKAELARMLGVSRTYITLLLQGKQTPSQLVVNKLSQLMLTVDMHQRMHGPLAQLAEQLTLNQPVGGSSPPRLTKNQS